MENRNLLELSREEKANLKKEEKANREIQKQQNRQHRLKAQESALQISNKMCESLEDTFGNLPLVNVFHTTPPTPTPTPTSTTTTTTTTTPPTSTTSITSTTSTTPTTTTTKHSHRVWTCVGSLSKENQNRNVWVRGRIEEARSQGTLLFLRLRKSGKTLQCVVSGKTSKDMLKWATGLPLESVVDVYGEVLIPEIPITSTTQEVEISVLKIHCVSRAIPELPFLLKDANAPADIAEKIDASNVNQDTRLDNRVLDLRTDVSQTSFRMLAVIARLFRQYLTENNFVEIHTPKLIGGSSEGGANVFTLKYFDQNACLAQSPQLYKQMAVMGDLDRVFEIGPVFRAENANTHRHLCEFTGADFEMCFSENYTEVVDMVDDLFKFIFNQLEKDYQKEIELICKHCNVKAFRYINETPRLDFQEACDILKKDGETPIPDDLTDFDFSTIHEKALGRIVSEKYKTDFFIVTGYPLNVRAFYTMPDPTNPGFAKAYDVFMRGEEIASGAQRIHCADLLSERATACGIDVATIKSYIDCFRYGAFPHGGSGIGLNRVAMLYLGHSNIRKTCMFPRDPKRLTP